MTTMYGNFNEIRNPTLRSWNRINTYLNIKERFGKVVAMNYLKKFKKKDLFSIFTMMKRIDEEGFENVRRSFIRERNDANRTRL